MSICVNSIYILTLCHKLFISTYMETQFNYHTYNTIYILLVHTTHTHTQCSNCHTLKCTIYVCYLVHSHGVYIHSSMRCVYSHVHIIIIPDLVVEGAWEHIASYHLIDYIYSITEA